MVVCALLCSHLTNRLVDGQTVWNPLQSLQRVIHKARREMRPFARQKRQILTHRIGHDQNVENRIAPSKPKRRKGCKVISAAEALS
jgi:uncharacterized protein with von Willebrand factor type A (vWA) domain